MKAQVAASTVKTIVSLRKKGMEYAKIAKALNTKGIKPPRAKKWSTLGVQYHYYKAKH